MPAEIVVPEDNVTGERDPVVSPEVLGDVSGPSELVLPEEVVVTEVELENVRVVEEVMLGLGAERGAVVKSVSDVATSERVDEMVIVTSATEVSGAAGTANI